MAIFDNSDKNPEKIKELFENLPKNIQRHSLRVSKISKFIFEKCLEEGIYQDDSELSIENLEYIEEASMYHDIGKALLDQNILNKNEYTSADIKYVQTHTTSILGLIDDEFLSKCNKPQLYSLVSDIVLFHHERWDGRGYPNEYFGESIPISARIVSIANELDKLMNPYIQDKATKLEFQYALKVIQDNSMTCYDPLIVSVVIKYAFDLERVIDLVDLNPIEKKTKATIPKTKARKIKSKREIPKEHIPIVEEKIPIAREGPAITFNLYPAYDTENKVAKSILLKLVLNDGILGSIEHNDYFYVAEKSIRSLKINDIEMHKMNECAEFIERKELQCDLDIHISTRNLKTPNYFENFMKLIEKYPKLQKTLCLTFDSNDFMDGDIGLDKITYLKDLGIKVGLDEKESLYNVSRLLSMYEIDYVKIPFKMIRGITPTGQDKIAFDGVMQIINNYNVIPIIYDVDNYLQFKKCKELNLTYLQGDYLGKSDKPLITNLIQPKIAEWIKNE